MIITINGTDYQMPVSLMDVTLNDRVEYDNLYGKDLREKFIKLIENKDEEGIEYYYTEVACKSLSFFGKIPLEDVENTDINDVFVLYDITKQFSDEINFEQEPIREIFWNNEMWYIAEPELNNNSEMKFGEFLDSKQSVQDLEDQKWAALIPLCSIYLRKKDEKYSEKLLTEREKLMKSLPLGYALQVGFFLKSLTSSSPSTSRYSGHRSLSLEVSL